MRTKRWLILCAICISAFAAVGLFYFLAGKGIGFSCLFYEITGLQCPGCGNSRALLSLLRLDPVSAIRHNLLFPLEFFYLGWVFLHSCAAYLKTGRFSYSPKYPWMDIALLVIITLWGIVRNFL